MNCSVRKLFAYVFSMSISVIYGRSFWELRNRDEPLGLFSNFSLPNLCALPALGFCNWCWCLCQMLWECRPPTAASQCVCVFSSNDIRNCSLMYIIKILAGFVQDVFGGNKCIAPFQIYKAFLNACKNVVQMCVKLFN